MRPGKIYIAEWYGPNSISEEGFDPEAIATQTFHDIDKAKAYAIEKAMESGVQGWACVEVRALNSQNYYEYLEDHVSELFDGDWELWRIT